jgi:hypothetical protein
MQAIYAQIEDELYEQFKDRINEKYGGMKKGDLQRAVVEAIEAWLKQK